MQSTYFIVRNEFITIWLNVIIFAVTVYELIMNKKRYLYLLYAVIGIFILVKFRFMYYGMSGFDDCYYSRYAADMIAGKFQMTSDVFSHRIVPALILVPGCYILGINDFSTALPAMIISFLLIASLCGIAFQYYGLRGSYYAALFYVSYSGFMYYSDKSLADIPLLACFFGWVYSYYMLRDNLWSAGKSAIIGAASVLMGWFTKEVIVMILPLVCYWMLRDLYRRSNYSYWLLLLGFCSCGGIAYILYMHCAHNDVGMRFDALAANFTKNPCLYYNQPISMLLRRLGYEYVQAFMNSQFAIVFTTVILYFLYYLYARPILSDQKRYWLISFIILTLTGNFFPASLSANSPLCADTRHFLFIVPAGILSFLPLWIGFIDQPKNNLMVPFSIILLCGYFYFFDYHMFWGWLFPLTVVVMLPIVRNSFYNTYLLPVALMLISMYLPIKTYIEQSKYGYKKQRGYHDRFIKEARAGIYIANEAELNLLKYFSSYQIPDHIKIILFNEVEKYTFAAQDSVYVIANGYAAFLCGQSWETMPELARKAIMKYPKVWEIDEGFFINQIPADKL